MTPCGCITTEGRKTLSPELCRDDWDTTKREDKASCCTDAELGAARASLARHTAMVPLCRMEYEQQQGPAKI